MGNVARTGDDGYFILYTVICHNRKHFLNKVQQAIAGCLGADQRTAVGKSLAGQNAGETVLQALVLTEQIADLSATDTDVAAGTSISAVDVFIELVHEALAEGA